MKTLNFITLFLFCTVLTYSQAYKEDYPYVQQSSRAYLDERGAWYTVPTSDDCRFTVYTDNIEHCGYPLYVKVTEKAGIEGFNKEYPVNFFRWMGDFHGNSFWYWLTYNAQNVSDGSNEYHWQYHSLLIRLVNCASDAMLHVSTNGNEFEAEFMFSSYNATTYYTDAGFVSMEQFRLTVETPAFNKPRKLNGKNFLSHNRNLKYVDFEAPINNIAKNCFDGCPKLEVVRFGSTVPNYVDMVRMFNENYEYTGSSNYPNLKAIVVPDEYFTKNLVGSIKAFICKAVADGTCKVISESQWKGKRLRGLSFSENSANVDAGDVYQIPTPTFSPSDAYDKALTYSSSDRSVAVVSDKGMVTVLKTGTATITVGGELGVSTAFTINGISTSSPRLVSTTVDGTVCTYDYFTGITTLSSINADGSVGSHYIHDNGGIVPFRGLIYDESVKRVLPAEEGSALTFDLDFVYLPLECSQLGNITAGTINWMFVTSRTGSFQISNSNYSGRIHNLVFNSLYFDDDDRWVPSDKFVYIYYKEHVEAFLKKVDTIYCTDRTKYMIQAFLTIPSTLVFKNLEDIPYETLIEDIKHKPAPENHVHLAKVETANLYSSALGITPKSVNNIFREQDGVVIEFDPYSHTLYYHRHPETSSARWEETVFSMNLEQTYNINNVVFLEGITRYLSGYGFTYTTDAGIKVVYTPKSMVLTGQLTNYNANGNGIDLFLMGNGNLSVIGNNQPVKDLVILNSTYAGGVKLDADSKVYAKSNLIHADVQYNLEAFDYLDFILAFNSVGYSPDLVDRTTSLTVTYYYNTDLEEATHTRTYKVPLDPLYYDVSSVCTITSVPEGLEASFRNGVLTVTQTGRLAGTGTITVKFTYPSGRYIFRNISIDKAETAVGTLKSIGLKVQDNTYPGEFVDVTDKPASYDPGKVYGIVPYWTPSDLKPSVKLDVSGSINYETYNYNASTPAIRYYSGGDEDSADITLEIGDFRASTHVGAIHLYDTVITYIHKDIDVFDTVRHVTEEEITVYFYRQNGKTYTVTDDLYHLKLKEITDTVRTTEYETTTIIDTIRTTEYDTVKRTVYEDTYVVNFKKIDIETDMDPATIYETDSYLSPAGYNLFNLSSPYREERIYFYDFRGQLLQAVDTGGRSYIQFNGIIPTVMIAVSDKGWYQKLLK